jgi:hypothetical protein
LGEREVDHEGQRLDAAMARVVQRPHGRRPARRLSAGASALVAKLTNGQVVLHRDQSGGTVGQGLPRHPLPRGPRPRRAARHAPQRHVARRGLRRLPRRARRDLGPNGHRRVVPVDLHRGTHGLRVAPRRAHCHAHGSRPGAPRHFPRAQPPRRVLAQRELDLERPPLRRARRAPCQYLVRALAAKPPRLPPSCPP